MQRADRADSATGGHASPDNHGQNITLVILEPADMTQALRMTDRSHEQIRAIRTLLTAATEAAEALECEEDRAMTPEYIRARLRHVSALVYLVHDHVDRIDDGVENTHRLLRDHQVRRAA